MEITTVQLTANVARDTHAGCSGAGVGHGSRQVRVSIIESRDRGGGEAGAARVMAVAQAEVLDKAGEGHVDVRRGVEYSLTVSKHVSRRNGA